MFPDPVKRGNLIQYPIISASSISVCQTRMAKESEQPQSVIDRNQNHPSSGITRSIKFFLMAPSVNKSASMIPDCDGESSRLPFLLWYIQIQELAVLAFRCFIGIIIIKFSSIKFFRAKMKLQAFFLPDCSIPGAFPAFCQPRSLSSSRRSITQPAKFQIVSMVYPRKLSHGSLFFQNNFSHIFPPAPCLLLC